MTFPHYPEYKNSGVEWIVEVPIHWGIPKIKHIASFSGGGTPSRDNLSYWNGNIPWVSPKDMKSEQIISAEECITESGLENSSSSLVPVGRVLMVVRSGILKHTIPIAINSVPVALNQDMKSLKFDTNVCLGSFFVRWVQGLNDQLLLAWAKQGATVESIEHTYLTETSIPLPPVNEQVSIVEFLDRETGKIDVLVAEQQKLIALLKEKRQAVISHAVTKGLDPNAPMKDSGIEWLGEIPEHWSVVPLGHLAMQIQTGPFGSQLHSEDYVEGETPVINPSNIQDGMIVADWSCTVPQEIVNRLENHHLWVGDIVFGRRGEMGRCAIVTEREINWLCGTGCLNVRLSNQGAPEFVAAYLRTAYVREMLKLESVGSTMDNLNTQILSRIPVPLPPFSEQQQIATFLASEAIKFNELTAEAQRAIELLKERRSALISAAVTGKIDVRGLVAADAREEARAEAA